MQLSDAEATLEEAQASANLADTVTSPGLIHDATAPIRQSADAKVTSAQAAVDDIKAKISEAQAVAVTPVAATSPELTSAQTDVTVAEAKIASAKTRVSLAQKALDALG